MGSEFNDGQALLAPATGTVGHLQTDNKILRLEENIANEKSADSVSPSSAPVAVDVELIKANRKLYLTVVACLGAVLVIVVLSITILSVCQLTMMGTPLTGSVTVFIPDSLIAIGSAAIGALAGILAPLSGRR